MTMIPEPKDTTVGRIYAAHEASATRLFSRRMGASKIGHACDRNIWYSFRWAWVVKHAGRMLRLFNRGNREEEVFESELKAIGIEIVTIDADTGRQFEFMACDEHFVGYADGVGRGFVEAPKAWHLLEFKTIGEKGYRELEKGGVEKARPEYYAQVQALMKGLSLDVCFFLAVNKNSDDLYQERIHHEKSDSTALMARAQELVFSGCPERMAGPADYRCKMCDYYPVCHGGEEAVKNCRTCEHSEPVQGGVWRCEKLRKELGYEDQLAGVGCPVYSARGDLRGGT